MNVYLQIGLGLLPGTIVVIVLLLKRKAFHLNKIFLTLLLTAGCGALLYFGVRNLVDTVHTESTLSQSDMFTFANALVKEGACDAADEVLEQYSETYGYDDQCRLVKARIALWERDFERANGLYGYLCAQTDLVTAKSEEVVFASGRTIADITGSAEIADLEKKAIEKSCEIPEQISDCAAAIAEISDTYESVDSEEEQYSSDVFIADEEAGVYLGGSEYHAVETIIKDAVPYRSLTCVNKAYIKACVLAGKYDQIAKQLTPSVSYHQLMVAAELYMGKLVKASDFPKDYRTISKKDARKVQKQIVKVYEKEKDDYYIQEQKEYAARIAAVGQELNAPELMVLKQKLTDAAAQEAGADETKVNLELAKIENYFGNESAMDDRLCDAIYTAQENKDDSYVAAMTEIVSVINDEDDTEKIKNVREYVDAVLDHSLTVDVEHIISANSQATGQEYSEQQYSGQDYGESDSYDDGEIDESVAAGQAVANKLFGGGDTVSDGGTVDYGDNDGSTGGVSLDGTTSGSALDFAQSAVDYVSKAKSAISIGKIDASSFETIRARVQIDSSYGDNVDKLKEVLKVYDCGAQIEDYTLEKLNYTGSNIGLVCDVSGSMSGNMQNLRDSVTMFIQDKNPNENLSVVTFDDAIVETKSFGTPDDELLAFADSMQSMGGTDMFSAVINSLSSFQYKSDENNVLILMTDGQDNNPKTKEEIYNQIGKLADEKGVTVYTMGLGAEVDTDYLTMISSSGNGDFVYVSDSVSLSSFYDMLHSQVNSQYQMTYTARDTITMKNRSLQVTIPDENVQDSKYYSLLGADEADSEEGLDVTQGISIAGLSPRAIYKGQQDILTQLIGTGFTKECSIELKLNGNIDYTLHPTFKDDKTYEVVIPAQVAVGSYDVEITINGKKKILPNGFMVVSKESEKTTIYGPYVFTSAEKIESGAGNVLLRGGVTMNGWLHFKGEVTLTGDLSTDGSISVSDMSGSYVQYNKSTAEGIGSVLADWDVSLDVPALNNFKLYNDTAHQMDYENYMVDDISVGLLQIWNFMQLDSPVFQLYPDKFQMSYKTGTTILPFQDKILKGSDDMFRFSMDGKSVLTDKNVGIVLDVDYKTPDPSKGGKAKAMNVLVPFHGSIKIKIDTIKNEYTLGAGIGLDIFDEGSTVGFEVSWKKNLIPDSVEVSMKFKEGINLPTAIPLSVNDFSVKVSDINKAAETGKWYSILFEGKFSLYGAKVADKVPWLKPFVGDVSILSMPETTIKLRFCPIYVSAKAELHFLDDIKLAESEFELGQFAYSSELLQINEEVIGVKAKSALDLSWKGLDERVDLEARGGVEADVHTKFIGIQNDGVVRYKFDWWVFNMEQEMTAQSAFGIYVTHDNKMELVLAGKSKNSDGKNEGFFYYIDDKGHCGNNNGSWR